MSIIDPVTLGLVKSALDAGTLRQVAHANNVANINTGGYRPFRVMFDEQLDEVRSAVREGRVRQLNASELPAAQMQEESTAGASSLDAEVAAMSQDAFQYQALTKALSRHLALLGMATSDGRR